MSESFPSVEYPPGVPTTGPLAVGPVGVVARAAMLPLEPGVCWVVTAPPWFGWAVAGLLKLVLTWPTTPCCAADGDVVPGGIVMPLRT